MGDCVESLAEVKVDNIHGSPFVYAASHVIVESHYISQARFLLGESMVTTPDNLLFLHLLDDGLEDKLLHHLSKDGGEADQPLVPWVIIPSIFILWFVYVFIHYFYVHNNLFKLIVLHMRISRYSIESEHFAIGDVERKHEKESQYR